MNPLDVAVVGGGQAGLAMAWHLRRRGLNCTVLDAGEPGGSWAARWDSLRLFTPARYDGLPGMPFPGDPDRHPTKDEVAAYLRSYVATFDLPVRSGHRVTELRRDAAGFALDGAGETILARQVVVATGPFQTPWVPALAEGLSPRVAQLHSAEYRRPDDLRDGPVLVVGGGNSGRQIALELARTRRVDLAVGSRAAVVPQTVLGRDLFWWLTRSGLVTASGDSVLGRRMRARGELVVGTSDARLREAGVTLRGRVTGAAGTAVTVDDTVLEVDTVVWATGYRRDDSWITIPGALEHRRRGETAVPGLYVLGLPWLHSRGSALLGFVGADAAHLAERIAARDARTGVPR